MPKYRAAVIGLGWMGMLYDLAERTWERFEIDDINRPTPPLDVHRRFYHHNHPGGEGIPTSYSEALRNRPEVELVAGADRNQKRLAAFSERYGIRALYTDAEEMLRRERPDIVAVCTNIKHRADLVCLAVECGAKAVLAEKPMVHTLEEADRMVGACARAGVPLCCGAIPTTHPSFAKAKDLVRSGAIGPLVSIVANNPFAQNQSWGYFLDAAPAWVVGTGDGPRRECGTDEFNGQGMMVTQDGMVVHFPSTGPGLRLMGERGEMTFDWMTEWRISKDIEIEGVMREVRRVELPWPGPQFLRIYGAIYCVDDVLNCLAGKLDEPKNSGRRVAMAIEVEIALKQSSALGGVRVDLPLADRSLGLNYDWFR